MKKTIKLLFCYAIMPLVFTCDDILEEDISDDSIQTISPNEDDMIVGNNVQFLWQSLDGADDYRVQVYGENQIIMVDSLVPSNEFTYSLNTGNYQWRVRGENFAYETEYTFPVNFSVEETDDLTGLNVILATPSDNLYTNDTNFTLTWNSIANADSYTLELIKVNNGDTTIFQDSGITSTSINLEPSLFADDAEYTWRVKATNNTSETIF